MLHLAMAGELQHVDLAHQVRADVGLRIDQRIADARLRADMDDSVEAVRLGECGQCVLVAKVDLLEGEGVSLSPAKPLDPGALQRRIVIVVEIVETNDLMTEVQKLGGGKETDESGGARHENFHESHNKGAGNSRESDGPPRSLVDVLRDADYTRNHVSAPQP